jgi:hypothetical protein
MLLIAFAFPVAIAVFALGYATAARGARQRLKEKAVHAAADYEELEHRLANLGSGLGVGA